jgi:hypothetical protein
MEALLRPVAGRASGRCPGTGSLNQAALQRVLLAMFDLDRNDPADQMIGVIDMNGLQPG